MIPASPNCFFESIGCRKRHMNGELPLRPRRMPHDIVVVGAGFTGLAAAHVLALLGWADPNRGCNRTRRAGGDVSCGRYAPRTILSSNGTTAPQPVALVSQSQCSHHTNWQPVDKSDFRRRRCAATCALLRWTPWWSLSFGQDLRVRPHLSKRAHQFASEVACSARAERQDQH
jgi:hypothetical protein